MGFERLGRGRERKTVGKEKEGSEEGLERRAHSASAGSEREREREVRSGSERGRSPEVNKRAKRQRANDREG